MWECKSCHSKNEDDDVYCLECGVAKTKSPVNHCSNPKCKSFNIELPNPKQKYCGKCGAATTYWKKYEDLL